MTCVAWIYFCKILWSSSSGTYVLCWRSSNLFTLSCLGMIIFISTLPWSSVSLSTSTTCHSGNTLLCKETIQCRTTSGRILIPHYNATTLSLRCTLQDKIDNAIYQKKQIQPNSLAKSSTVLFQNFDDKYCNGSTIELPKNGTKCKCKQLKSCQANSSTKTRRKGCSGKCLETAR
jgi:hypothetical protein